MPIICRLLQIPPSSGESLIAEPSKLEETVKSAKIFSGVYRYWHALILALMQVTTSAYRPTKRLLSRLKSCHSPGVLTLKSC